MIWNACQGETHIQPISGTLHRMVESQEQVATLAFVDSLDEQFLLEQMLEISKPTYPFDCFHAYDYLLLTPFRYPPLKWGSRFGGTHEPSLFYGAKTIPTVLAEMAYYRTLFWQSMCSKNFPPPKNRIYTEHHSFSVGYKTPNGIQLQSSEFHAYKEDLTHPSHYQTTQQLGTDMRQAGVQAFEYTSARDTKQGLCIGLFTPNAFAQKKPKNKALWLCELSQNQVLFKHLDSKKVYRF
ncbi:MAG: RES family NAD+ phosphorylase [Thiomicrorhabdus sp.]|nr:RES family NAD+ phosphorylase [Thiomicrorhabdus sp.]